MQNLTQGIAREYLIGYLTIVGVKDPDARIIGGGLYSFFYVVRGRERAAEDGRANYILPGSIMAEISREAHDAGVEKPDDRIGPLDFRLVETIKRALDGSSSLDQTVVEELKAHYESANAHAPGESPKPPYWDSLAGMWPNLNPA